MPVGRMPRGAAVSSETTRQSCENADGSDYLTENGGLWFNSPAIISVSRMSPLVERVSNLLPSVSLGGFPVSIALERLSDERLMEIIAIGRDQFAFGALYDRHVGVAFASALRICGERGLAEDAVQEAFLSLWRSRGRYDERRGNVRGWLLTIVRNRAIDVMRRAPQDRGALTEEPIEDRLEAVQRTELEAARREQARAIRAALESLPVEQSLVIQLAYYGGYTHSEIASMFATPVGTIKGRMRLGLQKLRTGFTHDQALF